MNSLYDDTTFVFCGVSGPALLIAGSVQTRWQVLPPAPSSFGHLYVHVPNLGAGDNCPRAASLRRARSPRRQSKHTTRTANNTLYSINHSATPQINIQYSQSRIYCLNNHLPPRTSFARSFSTPHRRPQGCTAHVSHRHRATSCFEFHLHESQLALLCAIQPDTL
jgi:hypothetical protein